MNMRPADDDIVISMRGRFGLSLTKYTLDIIQ